MMYIVAFHIYQTQPQGPPIACTSSMPIMADSATDAEAQGLQRVIAGGGLFPRCVQCTAVPEVAPETHDA